MWYQNVRPHTRAPASMGRAWPISNGPCSSTPRTCLSRLSRRAYSIFKRNKEAEADLLIGVNAEPQNPKWFLKLGVVYINSKNYKAAVNLNTVALRVNEKEPRYYNNRGVA